MSVWGDLPQVVETAVMAVLAISLYIPLYTYLGYPAILLGMRGVMGNRRRHASAEEPPSVTMIVPAHNEAGVIAGKVASFLETQYSPDRLHLLIGSDGSTDGTAGIVRAAAAGDGRVDVLDFSERRGKAATVNDLVSRSASDVIVISDANTLYRPDAVKRLVARLSERGVGAVCGKLVIRSDAAGVCAEEGVYWRYENALKKLEGELGFLVAINGQVLAFRRELFRPIPQDAITDDQHLGMAIMLDGWRIAFEPEAVAEERAGSLRDERARRVRISAGNYQSLFRSGWKLLNPARGMAAFAYLSHKTLRWAVPFCLPLGFAANAALLHHEAARWLFAAQAAAFGAMILGEFAPGLRKIAPVRLLHYFGAMNASMMTGFFAYLFGRQNAKWSRQERV